MYRSAGLVLAAAFAAAAAASPCRSPELCSANGCLDDAGICVCRAGWRASDCGELAVGGYAVRAYPPAGRSSWGGSVVREAEGSFHLFVDEMEFGCGLAKWRTHSRIVRAVSASRGGPFSPVETILDSFAHNAMIVPRSPHNPWLLLHLWSPRRGREPSPSECADGRTGATSKARRLSSDVARSVDARAPLGSTVLAADSLLGPWNRTRLECAAEHANCDFANPAMTIDASSGRAYVAYKVIHGPFRGKALAFASAPSWRGPYAPIKRRFWNRDPHLQCRSKQYAGCEDAFLWRDDASSGGALHALFHHADARTRTDEGGHSFSLDDGESWTFSRSNAYTANFTFADGSRARFKRVQRPQLTLDADGTPTQLVLGVAGDMLRRTDWHTDVGCLEPRSTGPCDRTFTLTQPIKK